MSEANQETTSQRMDRERAERKLESDAREFRQNDGNRHKARPTSQRRADELRRTHHQIEPVITPRPMVAASPAQPGASGTAIAFSCWKDGVMGTIELSQITEFTPL